MKHTIVAFTCLIIFSCTSKKETIPPNDFKRYLSSLDSLKTPIIFNTSNQLGDFSKKFDSALFKKFKNRWAFKPYGKLFVTDSIAVTIDVTAGDILTPIVMTFDLEGNKLDSVNLYKSAGRDMGYESNELVTINDKREIVTIRSVRRWDLNERRNNIIQGSDKLTVDRVVFKINGHGKIVYVTTKAENSDEFLSLFKDIDPTGLHIFTEESEGTRIEVNRYKYVNNKDIFFNIESCREGRSNIFAIGKFDLNKKYLGLITRQHSQYSESLVELLLWDKQQKTILKGIELADGFGDEGWYFDEESWVKDFQFDKELSVVTWRKDSGTDKNFENRKVTDTLTITHFNGATFETKALNKKDTSNYTLKNWR